MKELTKEMLADLLNGCEAMSECDLMKCRNVPTQEDAENSNLVVLFGRCDDLIVVRGAVYNELYISEGEQLALVLAGEKIDDDEDVMNNGDRMVDASTAYMAVDFAEMETERKAAKAFCAVHCPKGCQFDNCEECNSIREFKRKMEE